MDYDGGTWRGIRQGRGEPKWKGTTLMWEGNTSFLKRWGRTTRRRDRSISTNCTISSRLAEEVEDDIRRRLWKAALAVNFLLRASIFPWWQLRLFMSYARGLKGRQLAFRSRLLCHRKLTRDQGSNILYKRAACICTAEHLNFTPKSSKITFNNNNTTTYKYLYILVYSLGIPRLIYR